MLREKLSSKVVAEEIFDSLEKNIILQDLARNMEVEVASMNEGNGDGKGSSSGEDSDESDEEAVQEPVRGLSMSLPRKR